VKTVFNVRNSNSIVKKSYHLHNTEPHGEICNTALILILPVSVFLVNVILTSTMMQIPGTVFFRLLAKIKTQT